MKNKEAKSVFSSLENFSSIPPPELWDKIEAQLDQPKKKRRAIIWWSIAASLLVGLSVPTILHFNSNPENGFEINVGNNSNVNSNFNDNGNSNENNNGERSGNFNDKSKGDENTNVKLNNNSINLNKGNQVATTTVPIIYSKTKKHTGFKNLNQTKNNGMNPKVTDESKSNAIVANQNSIATISKSELINKKGEQVNNSNANHKVVVSEEKNSISRSNANKAVAGNIVPKSVQVNNSNANNKVAVSEEKNSISILNVNKAVAVNIVPKSVQVSNSNANNKSVVGSEKKTISGSNDNKEIVTNTSSKDSLNKIKMEVAQLENALVQLEKDKTTKKTIPESIDKWSVQVFAGVMSSQNYNNEKALGNTVASKQSSGYGVKTNYKLSKKWGVSSGFKINELGQKIAGVSYYEQQSYSGVLTGKLMLANDSYQSNSPKNNYGLVSISNNEGYLFASNADTDNGLEKGNVTQNLKYFEMPLEVSYALLNKKKTNISMNTGGFVGMLISNNLLLDGNSIGENKNVNQYVYGTLLSSTLQYEFYKKTKFFIEPGMNYYINPLENQTFNQFQWMFNVGLNLSF
jgi:hypothetical protein